MKRLILYQLIFLLIFNARIFSNNHKKIVIEEVLKIGGLENDLLYQWTDLNVDEKDFIYVLDAKDCSLKVFDSFGNLIKKTGRKGEGPGEFNFPVKIKCYGNRVYISELFRPGLKVFDKDLNYVSTIPINGPITDFYVQTEERILVAVPNASTESAALIE